MSHCVLAWRYGRKVEAGNAEILHYQSVYAAAIQLVYHTFHFSQFAVVDDSIDGGIYPCVKSVGEVGGASQVVE